MTLEVAVAVLAAVTALIVAITGLWREVRQTHQLVNSRMEELLGEVRRGSYARGQLHPQGGPESLTQPR